MKTVIYSIVLIVSVLVQLVLGPILIFKGIGPDFVILALCFAAFTLPRNTTTLLGFFTGLLRDSLGFSMPGVGPLLFSIIGFAAGSLLHKRIFHSKIEISIYFSIVIFSFFMLYHIFINFLSSGFWAQVITTVLPSGLITLLLLILFFVIIPKRIWNALNLAGQEKY